MCVCGSHDVYDAVSQSESSDVDRTTTSDYIVFQLQTTASRLNNALRGVDVSWIDTGMNDAVQLALRRYVCQSIPL